MNSFRSHLSWIALASGVSLLAPLGFGCKKDDKKSEAAKADESEKGGGEKKKGGSGGYTSGDVLKHVPSSCKAGRIYFNLGLFLKNEAVEKAAESLEDKFAEKLGKKDGKKAEKGFKALKKAGIDPARDVKEIAICMDSTSGDPVVAIGGDFDGKDPIGAMAKAAEEADEKDLEKKESDGVEYLKDGKQYIAAVAPNVVVFTRDKSSFADLKKEGDHASDWSFEKGRIVAFTVTEKKSGTFTGSIDENGDDLDVKFSADLKGEAGEEMADAPKEFKKQFEKMAGEIGKKLAKTPFKKIADDIGEAKIKVDGSKVTVTLTLPASDLGDAVKKAADSDPDELEKVMDL